MKEHRNRDGDPNPARRTPRWVEKGAMHRVPADEPNGFRKTEAGDLAYERRRFLDHAWNASRVSSPPRNPSVGVLGSLAEANARFR